jgi:MFS family permease
MISKYGIRPVLGTLITICTGATLVAALVVLDTIPTILLGFVIGASLAPIQPAARAVYPSIVPQRQLQSLQALDASVQELIWITGPVITVFLATQVDSTTAVLSTIVFGAGGGLWFLRSARKIDRTTRVCPQKPRGHHRRCERVPRGRVFRGDRSRDRRRIWQ